MEKKCENCGYKVERDMEDKEKQIEEMAKIMHLHICKDRPCKEKEEV